VRFFFTRREPEPSRILLVESGSRHLLEHMLPVLRQTYGESIPLDIVTCYSGLPHGLDPEISRAFCVSNYRTPAARKSLLRELAARRYSIMGIICSAEPIMTRWKWMLAFRLPAKVFVLNENGDYFWFDYGHWHVIRHFALYRAGLTGPGAVRTLGRLLLFPLTLFYLLLYAAAVHVTRALRKGIS
jgi:hypothetical protein